MIATLPGNGTLVNSNVPVDTVLSNSRTYTYDMNHKHAVAALTTGESYTYDANGNTLAPDAHLPRVQV